ncbi:MAG: HlyD family efflux transporter periplasmic adaptor subunit [Butyrivibrio sp.]|nr:HlyD family efflux transporter periplasmic adaptor subunit [Muribaculum sp.]MCM1551543.1 HlyD family efflux transporter periplasmic adaptor subunit [Butyrivibrio sp.]
MNEKSSKRREWVKTAAIVFLSVLLVLTFFSNTIMNYSLPEVATQYVESGTITAKIRGTGTVESGDPYSVKLKNAEDKVATGGYEVESIEVKRGDEVMKGDVLCHLAEGGNTAAKEKREELDKILLQLEIDVVNGVYSNSVLAHAQSGSFTSMSTYQSQITAKDGEIEVYKNELQDAKDTLEAVKDNTGGTVNASSELKKLNKAKEAYEPVAERVEAAQAEIDGWQAEIDANKILIQDHDSGKTTVDASGNRVPAVTDAQYQVAVDNNKILQGRINSKKAEIADDEAQLPTLKKALDKAQKAYDKKINSSGDDNEDEIDNWTKEVSVRQERLDDAEEAKAKLQKDFAKELELEDQLSKLREDIAKLEGEAVNGAVTAPISGTIISIYVKSGEETPANNVLFEIQPEGKGYTMEMTVTNEQAKRLSVGDVADLVNSWRYDDVSVVLSSIKPSPTNPSQNKLLTFDVEGDVMEGQSLNVSVGQKSAQYDLTVPNSAIREDNNGKFILTVETKSTPLSNRYIATRVDVEVLASDDTRSAISAPLYGYEYVITTSTAPVEAGKYIRLANNEG